ncbi:MAG: PVC-type heme-binding CxxCH protein [Planctomycetia bacterium]|nr:PVC-type heme-binding CxxCH protein [Planctomycetia bacterium]
MLAVPSFHTYLVALLACTAWHELGLLGVAQEPQPDFAAELVRVPPLAPADALASFEVQPPFQLELVATEPLVNDPVAVAIDDRLRMYVVEMRDYSEDQEGHLGQVRLLEDQNGDGKYDAATVFADKISWPTAVACWNGGVFIGAAPDIWYCRDNDGDGRADERRVVFTGFRRHNVQGLLNSFHWGLDNRIHGSSSSCGGLIVRPDQPDAPGVNVNGRDFAFDPRTLELEATSGGAQHGMSFDDWGRKFVSSNSDHLQQVMFEERRIARNPLLAAPGPRVSIAADGPQAEVFRRSPVERWRELRTALRVAGKVPGPIEGGGRAAGYFTGATGVTIYRGDAWPEEFHGLAIIGDVGSNIVHRKRLERNGLEYIGRRMDEASEFVASTDIWFRPAQFANAPDGSLYILDVYREVIEHPDSLPPIIKQHLDLTSGNDRGRIYRIVPEGFKEPKVVRPSDLDTRQLTALLEHPNGWHRDTAARLLFARQDSAAVPELERLAAESSLPLARMHALYVLAGLNSLSDAQWAKSIADHDPRVATHAVRLCEGRQLSESLVMAIRTALKRGDLDLDYEIAFTLAELPLDTRVELASELAMRYPDDRWQQLALQSSLLQGAGQVAARLIQSASAPNATFPTAFVESLAAQVAKADEPEEFAALVMAFRNAPSETQSTLAPALDRFCAATVARTGQANRIEAIPDASLRELMSQNLQQALTTATNAQASLPQRATAMRMLRWLPWEALHELVAESLSARSPLELQLAGLHLVAAVADPAAANLLLENWPGFSPSARSAALEAICSRPTYIAVLLQAIEQGDFSVRELDAARVKMLTGHADAEIKRKARRILADTAPSPRAEVLNTYQSALSLQGDVARGRTAFQRVCAACHRLENVGHELGPSLAAMRSRGPEAILTNVLDPNREVNPLFVSYVVNTTDGRAVTGIMAAETATSITLRRGEGAEDTILRAEIDDIAGTGMSLMPEGLEQQLEPLALADVIAYVMSAK